MSVAMYYIPMATNCKNIVRLTALLTIGNGALEPEFVLQTMHLLCTHPPTWTSNSTVVHVYMSVVQEREKIASLLLWAVSVYVDVSWMAGENTFI